MFEIIKSQPGTNLSDLLSLESFDPMHIRIAVARLIESGSFVVMKPATEQKDSDYRAIRAATQSFPG